MELQRVGYDWAAKQARNEQLYANKFNNVEEIDKFLGVSNLPRPNQEEIDNLKKKKISANKNPRVDIFIGEFYQTFKES